MGLPIHIKIPLILLNIRYYIILVLNNLLYINYINYSLYLWVSLYCCDWDCGGNDASHPRGGKCYPRWIWQINREIENERKPQNPRFDLLFTIFLIVYQKSNTILWSIRTFWYTGSAENKKQIHVREKRYISQKQQPKTKRLIFQKKWDVM